MTSSSVCQLRKKFRSLSRLPNAADVMACARRIEALGTRIPRTGFSELLSDRRGIRMAPSKRFSSGQLRKDAMARVHSRRTETLMKNRNG